MAFLFDRLLLPSHSYDYFLTQATFDVIPYRLIIVVPLLG